MATSTQQIEDELALKKYASAATIGLALLREQPDNIKARFLTALALQYNNQTVLAKKLYQQIIQSNPDLPEPRNNLAMIYLQQGKHDEAVDLLITSLKTHPAYATAWSNLSNLYQGLASEAYRRALSEEKDTRSVVHNIKLTALTSLHSWQEAAPVNNTAAQSPGQVARPKQAITSASTAAPSKPATTQNLSDDALIDIVKDWASAWSRKDLNAYLGAYTPGFKGRKASPQQWRQFRQDRITRPGKISVKLSNILVKSRTANQVIIDFHQAYRSANYQDKVVKRLYLTKTGENWKISRENTLAVL